MFLNITQHGKKFKYRRKSHTTPVEISFHKEYTSNIVTQLYKQNIVEYTISPTSIKQTYKIYGEKIDRIVVDDVHSLPSIQDKGIKNILDDILEKTNKVESKIEELSNRPVVSQTVISSDGVNKVKSKDSENTFIPNIDTKGMGIKTKVETKKSKSNTGSADVLRELLKGI